MKTLIQPVDVDDDVRDAFARLLEPKYDTSGGMLSVDDLLGNCVVFEVIQGVELVGHYALRVDTNTHGNEGVVIGAVGQHPERKGLAHAAALTSGLLPALERQFHEVRSIRIVTRRMPLVRELARQGYTCDGFILRKRLQVGHA